MAKKLYCLVLWIAGGILPLMTIGDAPVEHRDFANFWIAGKGILANVDIYDSATFRAFGATLLETSFKYDFLYPPHALFLFLPFALLPINASFWAWNICSAAFFLWAARPYMPKGLPTILAVLSPAAFINAKFGQNGLVSGALFLFAFRGNGLAAAALTFKPHVGFLLIPRLLENRRSLAAAILGTLVLLLTSAILFGGWSEFLGHLRGFQADKIARGTAVIWVLMSTTPLVGYGLWGWLMFAAGGLYLVARRFNVFTAATATFLISPYGFHYDMAVVCLGFGILLFAYWESMPPWHRAAASLGFLSPVIVEFGTWFAPPILLVALLVQTEWMDGDTLRLSKVNGRRLRRRLEFIRSTSPDVACHGQT